MRTFCFQNVKINFKMADLDDDDQIIYTQIVDSFGSLRKQQTIAI